jgi:HEAT repeat protein
VKEETAGRIHEALSSRGLAGKRDYVRSLEQRRDEQALPLLVECLSDESGYLRELAEAALAKLGERSGPGGAATAGALLLPLLRGGLWYARASAARALGGMAYAPAALTLLEVSEDRVDSVAREAAAALARIGANGGAARIAWELHRAPVERRGAWLARLRARDAALADRVERLLGAERLMSHPDPDGLRDDAQLVRAWEERTWREEQKKGSEPGEAPPRAASGVADASAR